MSETLPVKVPDLIEIKPDEHGGLRLWIDGELFPWATVSGYRVGEMSRREMPSVTVSIAAWRVTADHAIAGRRHRGQIAVIAGTYQEYAEWCKEAGASERGGLAFYATTDSLRGRDGVEVIKTGTWADREDIGEIEAVLRVVNRTA